MEEYLKDENNNEYIITAKDNVAVASYNVRGNGKEIFKNNYNEEHPHLSTRNLKFKKKDQETLLKNGFDLSISVFWQDLSNSEIKNIWTITINLGKEEIIIETGHQLKLKNQVPGVSFINNILHIDEDKFKTININNIWITAKATEYEPGNKYDDTGIMFSPSLGYIYENDSGHDKDGKALWETEISEQKQKNFTDIMNRMQIAMQKFPDDITVYLWTWVCETPMNKATIEENRKKWEDRVNSLSWNSIAQELFKQIDESAEFNKAFQKHGLQEIADEKLIAKARLVGLWNLEYNGTTFRELRNNDKIKIILDTTVGPAEAQSRWVSFWREFTSND